MDHGAKVVLRGSVEKNNCLVSFFKQKVHFQRNRRNVPFKSMTYSITFPITLTFYRRNTEKVVGIRGSCFIN